ncbi:hypothetical protein PMIN01_12591 [Paraphaeosphaeria minitans]|uniref:Uncharacterized protein n=1 Tax=Paraphaeosphaeria minitans TaxID=565426 RepID=A0A9P6KKE3_9PLEO|nr:hypothetical protein PMIN01_12591 [Paraphaeosphaeria minitans]
MDQRRRSTFGSALQRCVVVGLGSAGKMGRKWLTGIRAAAGKSGGAKQLCASQSSYAQPFGEGCQRPAAPTWARNEEEASLLHTRKGLMRTSRKRPRSSRGEQKTAPNCSARLPTKAHILIARPQKPLGRVLLVNLHWRKEVGLGRAGGRRRIHG